MPSQHRQLMRLATHSALALVGGAFVLATLTAQHFAPVSSFYQQTVSAALLLLAAAAWVVSGTLRDGWRLPWAAVVAGSLAVAMVAGMALGPQRATDMAIWPLGTLACAAIAAWMGHDLALRGRAPALVAALMAAFALAGIGTAILCWLQVFHPAQQAVWMFPRPVLSAPFGNLAQRNEAALVLALGLAGVGYFSRHERSGSLWQRVLAACAMALLLSALTLTQSRIGIAFTLVAGAAVGMLWASPRHRLRGGVAGIVAFGLGYVALQWLVYDAFGLGQLFPPGTQRLMDRGMGQRLGMLQVAWAEFSAHPLLGGGIGSFGNWEYRLALHNSAPLNATNAHNLFAQIGAELGLLGLLALIVPAAISLGGIARRLARERLGGWQPWTIAALAPLVMIAGYSMTEFPLWYAYYLIPTALLWGALDSTALTLKPSRSVRVLLGAIPVAMVAFLLWAGVRYFAIAQLFDYVYGFRDYQAERMEFKSRLAPLFFSPGFSQYTDALNFYALSLDRFMLPDKIALGERVVAAMPNAYFVETLGMYYALDRKPALAAQTFARACALEPAQCAAVRADVAHMAERDPKAFSPALQAFRALPQYATRSDVANVLRPWDKHSDGTVVTIDPGKTLFGFDLALYASGLAQAGVRGGTFVATPAATTPKARHDAARP